MMPVISLVDAGKVNRTTAISTSIIPVTYTGSKLPETMARQSQCLRWLFIVIISWIGCTAGSEDQTVVVGETGPAVVHAVLTKLDSCKANMVDDHYFLRRMAFVATNDGVNYTGGGGIWGLEESKFYLIDRRMMEEWLTSSCRHLLNNNEVLIQEVLADLYVNANRPIVSGLAATLYLHYLTQPSGVVIPTDVDGQAMFWAEHYNTTSMAKMYFIKKVATFERCKVNADIVFVLDISHSITEKDLCKVVDFETAFVQRLTIGPDNDRVGTVLFGRHAHNVYNLTSYQDNTEVLAAVKGIHNFTQEIRERERPQSTNIAAGLCNMWKMFTSDTRSLATVFRMAIVMSDGIIQNYPHNVECNWTFDEAVEEICALRPPVLVYVIGVSNAVDYAQLSKVATDGNHYVHVDNFDEIAFQDINGRIVNDLCQRATIDISGDMHKLIDGSLDKNEVVRYNLSVPVIGITVQVCVSRGNVSVYGSVSYPISNSALNDFQLQLDCKSSVSGGENCSCKEEFVNCTHNKRRARREAITAELHITIEGIGIDNVFVLNTTEGDVPTDCAGTEIAADCEKDDHITNNAVESSPIPLSVKGPSKNKIIIATVCSTTGFVALLICCVVILGSAWTVHRRKKRQQQQQQEKDEEEFKLLDNEYVGM